MATLLIILGIIPLIFCLAVLRGWALSILWSWFMVPLGLPTLGIAHAIGFAMTVAFLTHQDSTKVDDRETKEVGLQIAVQVGSCLGSLGIGWIITQFM